MYDFELECMHFNCFRIVNKPFFVNDKIVLDTGCIFRRAFNLLFY